MTYKFTAQQVGVMVDRDEDCFLQASLAEHVDGTGFTLNFQCGSEEPDDQDIDLGMDSHCLIMEDQRTAYGCVESACLIDNVLRITLRPEHVAIFELTDAEIEATIIASPTQLNQFREVLGEIFRYGRESAQPTKTGV
ncbi:hypothetical protein VHEMI07073 [[Torrubiella] hemipterigena]|uniref:Immunity protein 10 n=1 Tax=[Torrubiella] hemipterigena TaxID=1531966 RepID=A0A0A1TKL9_9HYPO|nr:hypothetical protein VHEMI07073 [[Torrubiella] hemipterigena]